MSHPTSYHASSSGRRKVISGVEPESDRNKEEFCEGVSSSAGLRRSGRGRTLGNCSESERLESSSKRGGLGIG